MTNEPNIHDELARVKAAVTAGLDKSRSVKPYRAPWWRRHAPIAHPLVAIDGRTVQLRLTWARLDLVGTYRIKELFAAATSGEAGAMKAAAELLNIFSGGEITEEEVMAAPIRLDVTVAKLYEEWLMAQYGPPMGRLQRWWVYLTNRPALLAHA